MFEYSVQQWIWDVTLVTHSLGLSTTENYHLHQDQGTPMVLNHLSGASLMRNVTPLEYQTSNSKAVSIWLNFTRSSIQSWKSTNSNPNNQNNGNNSINNIINNNNNNSNNSNNGNNGNSSINPINYKLCLW